MRQLNRNNTKEASNILKGIAISAVLINHYLNHYTGLNSGGFANILVTIFFFLSGYGIFCSLAKNIKRSVNYKKILSFYFRRFSKIFPLYWVALLIQVLVVSYSYPLSMFLGYKAGEHYWFISSILQCYLFAPIFFIALKKNGSATFLIVTALFGLLNLLCNLYPSVEASLNLFSISEQPYLGTPFLGRYIFFLGMCSERFCLFNSGSQLIQKVSEARSNLFFGCLISITFTYMFMEKLIPNTPVLGGVVLIIYTCIFFVRNYTRTDAFPNNFFRLLGTHSFSIYLLHLSYYFGLENIGVLEGGDSTHFLALIIFFPIFVFMSVALEATVEKAYHLGFENKR